jgi:Domain of unknown function (DUF4105)
MRIRHQICCHSKQETSNRISKKGGLAAFFLIHLALKYATLFVPVSAYADQSSVSEAISSRAIQAGISKQPTWAALLHVADGKAHITSGDFLLSGSKFSLENELVATIALFYAVNAPGEIIKKHLHAERERGEALAVCRFPARYLWLKSQIDIPALPIEACESLNEFKQRAPADEIAVVFASENLAQPSSMMGHVFLKLSGTNERQQYVQHAVSFITDAGGKNIAKLFFDSIVLGKEGFFTLGPYEEKLGLYLRNEQRTLWEYELELKPAQRDLVQAHLIELKQTRLTYFFQHYNCATVVDFILAVASGQQLAVDGFWITPKDVVKRLNARSFIKSSKVLPPNRWLIRAISEQLTALERAQIQADVDNYALPSLQNTDVNQQFVRFQLAKAYHAYRIETKQVDGARAIAYENALRAMGTKKFAAMQLETTSFKTPIDTPQDSQTEFGLQRMRGDTFIRLGFTPVSHRLSDDNRQYFAETELLLLDFSILTNVESGKTVLDRFVLYGAKSLIPNDAMSGGISGAIRLGVAPQRDADFRVHRNAVMEGALGLTKRLGRDVDVFALAGAGISAGSGNFNLYAQPEIGLVVREIFDFKTLASAQLTANALDRKATTVRYKLEQAKYFPGQKFSLHITAELLKQKQHRDHFVEFSARYLF